MTQPKDAPPSLNPSRLLYDVLHPGGKAAWVHVPINWMVEFHIALNGYKAGIEPRPPILGHRYDDVYLLALARGVGVWELSALFRADMDWLRNNDLPEDQADFLLGWLGEVARDLNKRNEGDCALH